MNSKDKLNAYYQLAKPGIIYGNLMTLLAGYLFASHWHNDYLRLVGLVIGAALIVGCGCVLNNVLDRGIDSKMARTKKRAIVTGQITIPAALKYAASIGVIGSILLGIFANMLTLLVAWFGLVVYVVIYGYAKRNTIYSTLIGAVAGAVPPLIGYCAYRDGLDAGGIIIFFMLVTWQLAHFYGIALYRQKDYQAAGLPIWPNIKGVASTQFQALVSIGAFSVLFVALFIFGYAGYILLLFGLVLGVSWLWYCALLVSRLSPSAWGRRVFVSSLFVVLLLSAGLAIGPLLP